MINKQVVTAKQQSGVVLVISLIMLLALTLIGVTSSNVTSLEEKMAANTKDMNLAFQSAEAALRAAEDLLGAADYNGTLKAKFRRDLTNADQGGTGAGTVAGYYTLFNNDESITDPATPTLKNPQPTIPFYSSVNWDRAASPKTYIIYDNGSGSTKKLVGIYQEPEYIIEEIGSEGADGGADSYEAGVVKLQSGARVITFRITAHGWGSNVNSVVTAQSVVRVTY
jgi:Tfp pilus assembly protein PilX